ncbi:hypothetical protein NBRC116583_30150 [Arenicella sp. 4NH20-0111]|uniref:hypothetical protein n=1 Tax=Arenicella sp. 4NH20-0111 TaxID=3127648 RepID=UPI003101BF08
MTDTFDSNIEDTDNKHASIGDLISMRDGDASPHTQHIDECVFCQARLEEVYSAAKSIQDVLLFEAELPVPNAAWLKIESELRSKGIEDHASVPPVATHQAMTTTTNTAFWSSISTAIYSLTAAVVFTGAVSLYTFQGDQQARLETQALQASVQNLMDNSRGLESVLQQVATRTSPLTVSQQSMEERLQWRLMMVDQKIHESESSDDINYEQIKGLWADRVDALNELNKLYYNNQVAANNGQI